MATAEEQPTSGNEYKDVEDGRFDAVQLQTVNRVCISGELLLEKVLCSPRQEVVKLLFVRVVPVVGGNQQPTLRLSQSNKRCLIFCCQFLKTYKQFFYTESHQRHKSTVCLQFPPIKNNTANSIRANDTISKIY